MAREPHHQDPRTVAPPIPSARPMVPGYGQPILMPVGKNVTAFRLGDEVFGGFEDRGTLAEYISIHQDSVVRTKPANLTIGQARSYRWRQPPPCRRSATRGTSVPARGAGHGASGGAGTFAVPLAKAFGAEVTGVCSTADVEMVASIGRRQIIDYTPGRTSPGPIRMPVSGRPVHAQTNWARRIPGAPACWHCPPPGRARKADLMPRRRGSRRDANQQGRHDDRWMRVLLVFLLPARAISWFCRSPAMRLRSLRSGAARLDGVRRPSP